MKHLSRWHNATAGTATAALAAGALGISSILTGAGEPPAPIELTASDSTDDPGPRVEVQQDERVAPTPDASDSPDSPSPASASPASASPASVSPDSPSNSPASISAASVSAESVSAESVSASTSVDSAS